MSNYQLWLLIIAIATIIFNAGGFVWLAKNHMAHVQRSVDNLTLRANQVEQDIALIKGALGIGTK